MAGSLGSEMGKYSLNCDECREDLEGPQPLLSRSLLAYADGNS